MVGANKCKTKVRTINNSISIKLTKIHDVHIEYSSPICNSKPYQSLIKFQSQAHSDKDVPDSNQN